MTFNKADKELLDEICNDLRDFMRILDKYEQKEKDNGNDQSKTHESTGFF